MSYYLKLNNKNMLKYSQMLQYNDAMKSKDYRNNWLNGREKKTKYLQLNSFFPALTTGRKLD